MKRSLLIFICFALVFALGGAAGWLLKPAPPSAPLISEKISLGEQLFQRLDARLGFTPEQKKSVRLICEEWDKRITITGRNPQSRLEFFEQFAPRIRELLKTNQLAAYDQSVVEARARHHQFAR